jgi:glyoxylase-like metal-dependent hydrolase (beta-lactamase superfamily II)
LKKLKISAEDSIAVFITHSDYDHIGSLSLFENATLYSWDTKFRYAEAVRFAPAFTPPDNPHYAVDDGEIIEINGRTIECIYTPGHKDDSVSYLVEGKYLFTGDLFVTLNNAQDRELQMQSRENVLSIETVKYVFTGHFGLFKGVRFFRWGWFI